MEYFNHLYAVLHPQEALIASQLKPEQFAMHYISGSTRFYDGKVLFAEVDPDFRCDFFDIDNAYCSMQPHSDGRPKATKFVSCYRVLEHLDIDRLLALYLTNPDGSVLKLDSANPDLALRSPEILRLFSLIDPLRMLILTRRNFIDFGTDITRKESAKSAPTVLYTQLEFDEESFLADWDQNSLIPSPIPGIHPSKLHAAILELKLHPNKSTKGLGLDNHLNRISYSLIRHGFMFASEKGFKFFTMPKMKELEENHFRFWRGML